MRDTVHYSKMSFLLRKLATKRDIDKAIRSTEDLVLVLRFGKESDLTCMQLDEIVINSQCITTLHAALLTRYYYVLVLKHYLRPGLGCLNCLKDSFCSCVI